MSGANPHLCPLRFKLTLRERHKSPALEPALPEPIETEATGDIKAQLVEAVPLPEPKTEASTDQNQQSFESNKNLFDDASQVEAKLPASGPPAVDDEPIDANETSLFSDAEMVDVPAAGEQAPNGTAEKVAEQEPEEPKAEVEEPEPELEAPKEAEVVKSAEAIVEPVAEPEAAAVEPKEDVEMMPKPDPSPSAAIVASTQDTIAVGPSMSLADINVQDASVSQLAIAAVETESPIDEQGDTIMAEASESQIKASRQRDEEGEDLPAAKRIKTGADEIAVASPDPSPVVSAAPAVSVAVGELQDYDDPEGDRRQFTPAQNTAVRKVLAGVKKTKNGGVFKDSVQVLWPAIWETYSLKVENPMDIGLMERSLREDKYQNIGMFKDDVVRLYKNSVIYNGLDHQVTAQALLVVEQIMAKLPEALNDPRSGPSREPKLPTRHTEPRAAVHQAQQQQQQIQQQARRQSRGAATSPTEKISESPVFALPPSGVPIIRRDSTKNEGDRPKRPIHPPKNKDLEYGAKGLKKKKLLPEIRFCEYVLDELKKPKHHAFNQHFLAPVDPIALSIPNYFNIIKKPMDLETITTKLYNGEYKTTKDFEGDINLMIKNCFKFNPENDPVHYQGLQLENLFKSKWQEKDAWLAKNAPPPPATVASTPPSEPESEEEVSEPEPEEEDKTANSAIEALMTKLKEEEAKIHEMISSAKPELMMVEVQQQMINMIQKQIVVQRMKLFEEKENKPKKAKAPKAPKAKAAPGAGAAGKKAAGAAKKAAGGTKKAKSRVIGAVEKEIIAGGINDLDPDGLQKAIEIIKKDTNQPVSSPC